MLSALINRILRVLCAAALAAVFSVTLSGCALSALTAENVMEPPEPFGDGAELQIALEDELGPQITLRYPRSGKYRSAVVRADVDTDDLEEAIVFYRQATESSGARMVIMDIDSNREWVLVGEFSDAEGEIDRVLFGDINGDGALDIVTGWSAYSDYGTYYVHSLSQGQLLQLNPRIDGTGARALSSYTELAVGDFDQDGTDELMTVCLPGSSDEGEARLLKWRPFSPSASTGALERVDTISLRDGAAGYTGCISGNLEKNVYGLVVDSRRLDGSYSSELLVWDRETGSLTLPSATGDEDMFRRTLPTASGDVDQDGYIEMPSDRIMPDCGATGAQPIYMTCWHHHNGSKFITAFNAIMRPDDGYYFLLPDRWLNRVTAQSDDNNRTLHFYLAGTGKPLSTELMRITVFTLDEWEEENSGGWIQKPTSYQEICTTDYYVYAVMISEHLPTAMEITFEDVFENFAVLA